MPTNDATDPTLTGGGKAYPTFPKSTEPVSPHARFPRTMTLSWAQKIEFKRDRMGEDRNLNIQGAWG